MRPLAFTDHGQAEGVHHIAHVVALLRDPAYHDVFRRFGGEVLYIAQNLHQFAHNARSIGTPAFLHVLLGVGLGGHEEEAGLVPQLFHEIDTTLHQGHDLGQVGIGIVLHLHAVLLQHRLEQLCNF